ncbi:FxLD family lanthipeptide [Micromonospora sp. WMMD1082]|uniref:FxLD family lanthipeptide n=1 Tax=Micromonospora sp. WMMD1082 TaxID=3016104 RepID=UPI002416C59E|nr:FxLD family lanthipeptide [Micromonospora sp. WMMD1082]MDG4795150.1 FxLD family lanthipeptide [Micromonospora sp. WMMD1082]
MTVQLATPLRPAIDVRPDADRIPDDFDLDITDDFDLDITFVEAGGTVEHIIKMTEDNCGSTCESACTSC